MKKILFGIIGLLALVVVLIVLNPGFVSDNTRTRKIETMTTTPVSSVVEEKTAAPDVEIENIVTKVTETEPEPIYIESIITQEVEPVEEQITEPVEEQITEPVEEQITEPVEEQVAEPVEEPVAEPLDLSLEPIEEIVEEKVVEPEDEYEERVTNLPEYELEKEVESGELFFEDFLEQEPVVPQQPTAVEYIYKEKEYSNKGMFFQSGMSLGAGLHDYHGDRSLMYTSGIEFKFGAFFTENIGVYAFAKPDFFAEVRHITTFIALPNSLHVTAGAGVAFDFGKFGVQAQAGYSILNIGFEDIKPYAFGSFSVIPEFNFVKQGKTTVKLTMPLTFDISEMGYDAFGGIGLSVKLGGKEK